MEVVHGRIDPQGPLAILPGAFHPPTIAHLGLAELALAHVRTVVFTLPRAFPHKAYDEVSCPERLRILGRLAAENSGFAVALSTGGLFVEMARELRALCPGVTAISILCGRDAAERFAAWSYEPDLPLDAQRRDFSLLVACRDGEYAPPPLLRRSVELLRVDRPWDRISSTLVREAIGRGAPWRHLVPPAIHSMVSAAYSSAPWVAGKVQTPG